jgi:hypothetical protein
MEVASIKDKPVQQSNYSDLLRQKGEQDGCAVLFSFLPLLQKS